MTHNATNNDYIDERALRILQERFKHNPDELARRINRPTQTHQEPVHESQDYLVLRVDTQPMLHSTQDNHLTGLKPMDFKQLEKEVTRKAIVLIAAVIAILWLLSRMLS